MASTYGICVGNVAKNIAIECDTPIVGGYTGRGVLLQCGLVTSITQNDENPRIVEAINVQDGSAIVVDNVVAVPFEGSNTALNADSGRGLFTKLFQFRVPLRGADTSRDVIEPLLRSPKGFLLVAEKNDKRGDGSFEVVGLLQPLKVTADGITRNENENGGDWIVTMSCTEFWAECSLLPEDGDYADALEAFEALMQKSV